jgi:hypothetical protein
MFGKRHKLNFFTIFTLILKNKILCLYAVELHPPAARQHPHAAAAALWARA